MPEGPEIETEKLHEAVKEELEREGGGFLRSIALTTAIFAVVAAIAALQAGGPVNAALMLRTDAARLQSEASDQWAFYQAKGVKAAVQEASRTSWLSLGKQPPAEYGENQKRYAEDQEEIQAKAQEKERERDEKIRESDHLLHRHHRFAQAVALLQVSIALAAVAALTRQRPIWWIALLAGLAGIVLAAMTFVAW